MIQRHTTEQELEQHAKPLRQFLKRMGRDARQGAIGLAIDGDYLEIGFPVVKARATKGRKLE